MSEANAPRQGDASVDNVSQHNNFSDECPTCGDTFASKRGVKVHHKKVHGESLAHTISCDWCGDEMKRAPCKIRENKNLCSKRCRDEWLQQRSGDNHPSFNQTIAECTYCGERESVKQSRANRSKRYYCSLACRGKHMSQTGEYRGKSSPRWKGGYKEYYGPNWQKQRQKARKRDGYKCQSCGCHESDMERELDVHHITPFNSYEMAINANKLNNLVSLCRKCHAKRESNQ